ncbi:MAG: Acetophenone carboxylase gamma subunit [bacterium ADurb.Bin236]|nr:MAG: Acetophenone carboxylase gamma subunit [bacterium ADurb.Bin236]HPN94092.1 hydantoinase/oxoprolinase family protein [bacterium]
MTLDSPTVRIGIDVGGTFTHAVAVDNRSLTMLAKVCRPTTHNSKNGVAEGIWQCLDDLLAVGVFKAEDVVFVAHSTTQATNALLEGDVAPVTLIGMVEGVSGAQAKRELSLGDVEIAAGRKIPVKNLFFSPSEAAQGIRAHLDELRNSNAHGAGASFVVAEPFSVDDPEREKRAAEAIADAGFPVTASSEVSGLYGLRARARTSVVNASILPKMTDVADKTKEAASKLGLAPVLMIMRSDGGVMAVDNMRRSPILTILSGPAAGVSAAILYEKMANGYFVEVGGTSTDISIIIDGKPQRKQAAVGGNILYLKTLDVRTIGVAGGSMLRVSGGKIKDVGPRSAHIAGLPYACFAAPEDLAGAKAKLAAPRDGDPGDYAVIETNAGGSFAITATCAANALGTLADGDYSSGSKESAKIAFEALSALTGRPAEALARDALDIAALRISSVCEKLGEEYKPAAAMSVIGGGGGASVVAPPAADKLRLPYRHAKDAEVISAVGAAMAMLKNVIEKSVVDATDDDVAAIRAEMHAAMIGSGADPDSIEIEVEIDKQRNTLRASGSGSASLVASRGSDKINLEEAKRAATAALGAENSDVSLIYEDSASRVFSAKNRKKGIFGLGGKTLTPAVVVDMYGLARLTIPDAFIVLGARSNMAQDLSDAISRATTFGDGGAIVKQTYLVFAGKVIELSKLGDPEKMKSFAEMEISAFPGIDTFCVIFKK